MAGKQAARSNEQNKAKALAGRMAYLRQYKFTLEGFGSNEPVPSLAEASAMAARNRAKMVGDAKAYGFKTPSVQA